MPDSPIGFVILLVGVALVFVALSRLAATPKNKSRDAASTEELYGGSTAEVDAPKKE